MRLSPPTSPTCKAASKKLYCPPAGENRHTIDLTNRPSTAYLLTFTTAAGKTHTIRLLKQSDIFSK